MVGTLQSTMQPGCAVDTKKLSNKETLYFSEFSCARTDAVFVPRFGKKSHIRGNQLKS